MKQEDKKIYGLLLWVLSIVTSAVGYFVYTSLLPTDYLHFDSFTQMMHASNVMMVFLAAAGIMGVIGFILVLDWYKSKPPVD
ncbi:MAG: hypothetical protein ACE5IO_06570 [Thermoplasmata archaeon]